MSISPLPKVLHPIKFADRAIEFQGVITLNVLPRAAEMCFSNLEDTSDLPGKTELRVGLHFYKDEQNYRVIEGHISGQVQVQCQRCLHGVDQDIDSRFTLAVVLSDDQAKHLPKYYEPLLVENDEISLYQLVDDELILALPMFSYHQNTDCLDWENKETPEYVAALQQTHILGDEKAVAESEQAVTRKKENPFAVLSQLKVARKE